VRNTYKLGMTLAFSLPGIANLCQKCQYYYLDSKASNWLAHKENTIIIELLLSGNFTKIADPVKIFKVLVNFGL
jgi:hypothetical protein